MKIGKWFRKIHYFLSHEIWRFPTGQYPRSIEFIVRQIQILLLTIKGLAEDEIQVRATALTYYSVFALVPLLAVFLGMAKIFGSDTFLNNLLTDAFQGREEVLSWLLGFADSFLSGTTTGVLAGFGIVALIWSVMNIFGSIEQSLNEIWEVNKSRHFARRLRDYAAILFLAPLLLIILGSSTVFITTKLSSLSDSIKLMGYISPFLALLLKLVRYPLIWIFFTTIYFVIPNTKVRFSSALIAGMIAGTFFELLQWGYVEFQVGVSKYNAIYGSFAALPLFVIWLQSSWLIVLMGAELSFANQNVDLYELESESLRMSVSARRAVALLLVKKISLRFLHGDSPASAEELAREIKMPVRLVRLIIVDLVAGGVLLETDAREHKTGVFLPARDIHSLTVRFIYETLDHLGDHYMIKDPPGELKQLMLLNTHMMSCINKFPYNQPIFELDIESFLASSSYENK